MSLAYIISAFRNPDQLVRLVNRLDTPTSSFVLHVDARRMQAFTEAISLLSNSPRVTVLAARKFRYRSFDHVDVTLSALASLLRERRRFSHVLLLTGQDYPIKPLSLIHSFLSGRPAQSFMEFEALPNERWSHGGLNRLQSWHFFFWNRHFEVPTYTSSNRIRRRFPGRLQPYGGSGYWCLARDAVEYVVDYARLHPEYVRFFRHVDIPDETFFHSILLNSPLRRNIANDDLRYIDWDRPQPPYPALLTRDDFAHIRDAPDLFARKFDASIDSAVLDLIDEQLL